MRILSAFLIVCLLLPFIPEKAMAQLLLNPTKMPEVSGLTSITAPAPTETSPPSSPSAPILQYIPQGNLPEDYKLGPGDQLAVHMIVGDNALSLDYNFVINPEGKIFFPNVGEVSLSGLSLSEGKAKLIQKIKSVYPENFSLSMMITTPKLIKIYVTGQVSSPGLKVVYDGSKISEVARAVGVASGGSNRNVIIKRGNEIIKVDLYKILYLGDIASDINVRMGDVIEIPAMGSARVTIVGEVPRPGQYELKEGERLKDALAMAGYVGVNSALSEVAYLKRQKGKEEFVNYKLNLYDMFLKNDDSQNIELTDGDIVSIPPIKAYIYIYGEVGRPGRIDFYPGLKLSDYLNLAGGPTVKANLSGVTVTRQENGKAKVYHVNAGEILQKGNLKYDVELFGGDVVFVPGNFFYVSDFASFANTILLALTLYTTVVSKF